MGKINHASVAGTLLDSMGEFPMSFFSQNAFSRHSHEASGPPWTHPSQPLNGILIG